MDFGYFHNTNNVGLKKHFTDVMQEVRELAGYIDEHNWHSIWFTEHHFGHEGFEVCPNPVMMSTDISARTKRIRIGQAANIVTFWHPLRFAEDLAMLDQMNGGRTEVALGRGLYGREGLQLTEIADPRDFKRNYQVFEETLDIMRRAWSQEFFSYKGEVFEFPAPNYIWDHDMSPIDSAFMDIDSKVIQKLALVPRTLQQPTPPMWQVVDGEYSIRYAAENNLQAMFWIPPTDSLKWRFELYRDARSQATGENLELGEGVAVVRDMFVTETMKEAEQLAGQGIIDYLKWVCHWRGLGNHVFPGEALAETPGKLDLLDYDWLHPRNLLFGTPDYITEKIMEMKDKLGLKTLLVWSNFPGVEHEAVMASVKMFTEEVMPRFNEGEVGLI